MKYLYLIRHAKSSWAHPHLSDRDRPLNKRGDRDAPKMAEHLFGLITTPDVFVCSPSKRTNQTAEYFLKVFSVPREQMIQEEELYHAGIKNFVNVISHLNDYWSSAVLFSHNPGITDFVNRLVEIEIENIPTCGLAGISIEIDTWKGFNGLGGKLDFYHYPKGI